MKLLSAIFLLITFQSFAQQNSDFFIDSIPVKGLLLDQGWVYKKGDNIDWAQKEIIDKDWSAIDPDKEIVYLPGIMDDEVKWLRLKINVKNKILKPVGIAVNQAGASEIYVNGKLVHRFGHFDVEKSKVIAYDPLEVPIYLPIDTAGYYTIAVRYRLQPDINYTTVFGLTKNSLFKATLVDLVPTLHIQRSFNAYYKGLDIFIVGSILMLFIFHLALFIYQRDNKILLLLTIYLFGSTMIRVLKIIGQSEHLVENRFFILNMSNALIAVVVVLLTTVVYRMAKVRYDKFYYILIVYEITYILVSVSTYGKPYQTFTLLVGTLYGFLILIRLVIKGSNKGIKGFTLFGVFISINIIGLILITSVILSYNYGISPTGHNDLTIGFSPYWVDIIFTFASISVPIGLSLFIGIENRETNKELSNQLALNEQLKNQAIKQEIEKQQILEDQNDLLEAQVVERTAELNQSLETLKSTQAQLIQSEKLASLGELTAGIAHEIQNPLNFVNNFSELSVDLAKELKEEVEKLEIPEKDKEYVSEIIGDLSQNQEKINHHGKRASDIVKGMLEHSRSSTGQKESTDINALCDEFLRLAYHGLRAKDKSFNATMETHFGPNLPKIDVIPQDIGRVILNLISNAFYAVNERSKNVERADSPLGAGLPASQQAGGKNGKKIESNYVPTVSITTHLTADSHLLIAVKDNGSGIPTHIKDKIFQPFFTTKPTGQGTGLGLSLSYDIVKAHGGELKLETKEGEGLPAGEAGSTFIITLPYQTKQTDGPTL
jgi:signal transduction histidine kinase